MPPSRITSARSCSGVSKVASKMGISVLQSYQSAQIFEAVGIRQDVIDRYFTNTVSRVGGIGLDEINEDVEYRHDRAFDPLELETDTTLDSCGNHRLRSGCDKEDHLYNPADHRHAAAEPCGRAAMERFRQYTAMVDDETRPHTLRGLLEFAFDHCTPVPLDEVEPADEIVKRFKTGAMSYGSISQEAHECLAEAMNRLGGRSNSGEGGEMPRASEHGARFQDQAGGLRPFRRDQRISDERRRNSDQNGAGCEARRGRPFARRQGVSVDRQDPAVHAGREPDLPAAAPRYLLH